MKEINIFKSFEIIIVEITLINSVIQFFFSEINIVCGSRTGHCINFSV